MNNIYLVGFMGTGKTTVGKELARKLKWHFVDLDDLIELRQKMTIADIFALKGEACFRKIEKLVLADVAKEKKFIVACGGGIVIDPDNIKLMKKTGHVICLGATADIILKRTKGLTHRPLLNIKNPKEKIELLLKMRAPFYLQADTHIDTSKLSIDEVVKRIYKLVHNQQTIVYSKKKTKAKKKK